MQTHTRFILTETLLPLVLLLIITLSSTSSWPPCHTRLLVAGVGWLGCVEWVRRGCISPYQQRTQTTMMMMVMMTDDDVVDYHNLTGRESTPPQSALALVRRRIIVVVDVVEQQPAPVHRNSHQYSGSSSVRRVVFGGSLTTRETLVRGTCVHSRF